MPARKLLAPAVWPGEQTREQGEFILSQSLGITRSQGAYQAPEWLAELSAQYVAGQIGLAAMGARHDEHNGQGGAGDIDPGIRVVTQTVESQAYGPTMATEKA